jgi:hypothetical protein
MLSLTAVQDCQSFVAKTYQNGENILNYNKIYQKRRKILPDGHQIDQMAIKYTNIHRKALQN